MTGFQNPGDAQPEFTLDITKVLAACNACPCCRSTLRPTAHSAQSSVEMVAGELVITDDSGDYGYADTPIECGLK